MRVPRPNVTCERRSVGQATGLVFTEFLVAVATGCLVLLALAALGLYGVQSFAVIGNCTSLDIRSRQAADALNAELRMASSVVRADTRSLILTNYLDGYQMRLNWDADQRRFAFDAGTGRRRFNLAHCDFWQVNLYATPSLTATNLLPGTNVAPSECRVVEVSWRCSRTNYGRGARLASESTQRVRIALRNNLR